MEEIIARQNAAAKAATGKTFVLGIARIIFELAIAQLIVNFLIRVSGQGLLNLLFYLYAVVLLVRFMTKTVAGCIYTLRSDTLVVQRLMGDSTVLGVEIPLGDILSIRPIVCGEQLHLDYRQVTYVDRASAPGLRMRAAFFLCMISSHLGRYLAGAKAHKPNGYVIVYTAEKKRCACAFRPDAAFAAALEKALPDVFMADERLAQPPLENYAGRSLKRAFGDLYPHVAPLISEKELEFEREEFARRNEKHIHSLASFLNVPDKKVKQWIDAFMARVISLWQGIGDAFSALRKKLTLPASLRKKLKKLKRALDETDEDTQEETQTPAQEDAQESEHEKTASRRRRSRQE